MFRFPLAAIVLTALFASTPAVAEEEAFVFETWGGQKLDAFRGSLTVPENRKAAASRSITLSYVRLPATGSKAGPPIVYLAGGPGASGIEAINYRLALLTAMRQYGDVIAFDQRGTGATSSVPRCQSKQVLPTNAPTSDERFAKYMRDALEECLAFWQQQGVDLAGYNTVENARDLEALRLHLGARKIVLLGVSYGSTLTLAALREIEASLDRVILSSVRGLDQTIKLPGSGDDYLQRLQKAIDSEPAAKAVYPDVKALIRRVHTKLEREPVRVKLKSQDGEQIDYLLQRRDAQILAVSLLSDPRDMARALGVYLALDRSVDPALDRIPRRLLPDHLAAAGQPISFGGMGVAVNLSSGISPARKARIEAETAEATFGPYLDPTRMLLGLAPTLDLGEAFRVSPVSEIPTLLFSGTLDGRTVIEEQRQAVRGLRNLALITVENAGHNLYDAPSPEMLAILDEFMAGKRVTSKTIRVDPPPLVSAAAAAGLSL